MLLWAQEVSPLLGSCYLPTMSLPGVRTSCSPRSTLQQAGQREEKQTECGHWHGFSCIKLDICFTLSQSKVWLHSLSWSSQQLKDRNSLKGSVWCIAHVWLAQLSVQPLRFWQKPLSWIQESPPPPPSCFDRSWLQGSREGGTWVPVGVGVCVYLCVTGNLNVTPQKEVLEVVLSTVWVFSGIYICGCVYRLLEVRLVLFSSVHPLDIFLVVCL